MWLPRLREGFSARFGRPPTVMARAPGRVNLLGEHTDYNEGFVLPVALRQCTWFACAPRPGGDLRIFAARLNELHQCGDLAGIADAPAWSRYVLGVAALLRERGARLAGFDACIDGDLPLGAGLSSSAALEVSAALALSALAGEAPVTHELIDLCVEAERRFAGVPCGIMDQTASLLGRADHAMLLDCRDRRPEFVPIRPDDYAFFVVDSGIPRRLAESEYARRREECALAVTHFRRLNPQVRALRDVSLETVRAQALQMPPIAAARALHVVTENRRTLAGAEALRRGDWPAFGELMNESHRSLRDDYEVSLPELDALVERLTRACGAVAARLTGAGFGGAVLGLARRTALAGIEESLRSYAAPPGGPTPRLHPVEPGPGAAVEQA